MSYHELIAHYERCLAQYGDTPQGVDWPKAEDVPRRYQVMRELWKQAPAPDVLDFGCGAGHFYEWLQTTDPHVAYRGLDASPAFIALCQHKHPHLPWVCADVLTHPEALTPADYVVMNGVLTEKRSLSFEAMWDYAQQLLVSVFAQTRRGLAFNVMSPYVDWERDDLFHLPPALLLPFVHQQLSRHVALRMDYGLYEYTVYVYREAQT